MKPDLEDILARVERLPPEDRARLIQRVAGDLASSGPSAGRRRMAYGEFRGQNMSSEEDFTLAEWRPSKRELHGR